MELKVPAGQRATYWALSVNHGHTYLSPPSVTHLTAGVYTTESPTTVSWPATYNITLCTQRTSDWVSTAATRLTHQRVCLGESITQFLILTKATQGIGVSHDQKRAKGPKVAIEQVSWEYCRQGSKITSHLFCQGYKMPAKKQKARNASYLSLSQFKRSTKHFLLTQNTNVHIGIPHKDPDQAGVEYLPCTHCALMVTGDAAAGR